VNILILGGTAEARALASRLVALGHQVTSSLAGVTSTPTLPQGKLRVGGFGGVQGLSAYLQKAAVDLLIDATHPFARQMSDNAHAATDTIGVMLMRLERASWQIENGDCWVGVTSMAEAVNALPEASHVFVTTGRKTLDALFAREDLTGVIRTVELLEGPLPSGWQHMLDRPPYELQDELALFSQHRFTHLLSKNAGGPLTYAKIQAARVLNLPVVMIKRPGKRACLTCATVDELIARLGRAGLAG
jgi:precorrin-6A/cobalt-precorrin-6A reductase